MLSPSIRKSPVRKRKVISPEQVEEYVEEENIVGYPVDTSNISVSCARTYCAAVTATKNVIIWGDGDHGSRGILKVPMEANNIQQIATGDHWIVALKENGDLISWGERGFKEFSPPNIHNVVKVVACNDNYLALLSDGTVRGWGYSPVFRIKDMPSAVSESQIEDISVGTKHAVVLTRKGRVIIWGDEGNIKFPKIDSKIVSIKAFGDSNLALQENGKLLYWGTTRFGQQYFPEGLKDEIVISYSLGLSHCAAVTESGKFFTWGWNVAPTEKFSEIIYFVDDEGEIDEKRVRVNIEEKQYFIKSPPDAFKTKDEIPIRVYCGYDVTYVLVNSGDVIAWGDKKYDLLDIPEVTPAFEVLNQPNIDLRKYGISLDIDQIIHKKYIPKLNIVKTMTLVGKKYVTENGSYKMGEKIGEGGFGIVFSAEKDGIEVVAKFIKLYDEDDYYKSIDYKILEGVINETANQIIIQEETKRLKPGFRVCGDVYEVAIDPIKKLICIFQEKIDIDLRDYVKKIRPSADVFADIMIQMANKLNWLYDSLEFNHRDFKDDNSMIKYKEDDSPEFLLIDLGFACMTYRGVRIKGSGSYFRNEKCFQETRDITFMLYTIYKHSKTYLPVPIVKTLRNMLIFKIKGKICDIAAKDCPSEKNENEDWQDDLYDILNLDYVYNPNATTDTLIEKMTPFLKGKY